MAELDASPFFVRLVVVASDGGLGREVLGQDVPLAAGPQDVEDGVDALAHVGLPRPAAGVNGQVWFDRGPWSDGLVVGLGSGSHSPFYASPGPYGTDS